MKRQPITVTPDITLRSGTSRRQFLTWTAMVGAMAATPAVLGTPAIAAPGTGSVSGETDYPFTLGIASGDPLPDSVILWTRLAPEVYAPDGGMPATPAEVKWEVAEDEKFTKVVKNGTFTATADSAHSVHVDVKGLEPWHPYFYRFHALGHTSEVGRTKTTPASGIEIPSLSFAWASCQAWWDGHYTAYDDLATNDLDIVFHLGDYIYEGKIADNGIRDMSPLHADMLEEIETLPQYRMRYALYKSDKSLQGAHAVAPWVVTMDDHEVDNNWAGQISQDDDDPVKFLQRRAQAFRAWWEHNPTRISAPTGSDLTLYRRVEYGNLATFSVLDTRQYRSDQLYGDKSHVQDAQTADPKRTITGDEQEKWILDGLGSSSTTWNVLAHQTVITDLPDATSGERLVGMDSWSGYEASRHRILGGAKERGVENLVSIVGDIHRTVVAELREDYQKQTPVVGVEIAGTSISSAKDGVDVDDSQRAFMEATPSIKFGNKQRGYVRNVITPGEWKSEMRVTDKVSVPGRPMSTRATITVPAGKPEIHVDN
ncbi:alkaline phosphatase D family protein [Rhodococcus sp. NPDC058521]|uniref:alkaline phosphatase D family protein n=1 Tax=Rhodococcus sp. NPDC058521 TaxID=3346536 RepID=UPI00364CFD0D